MNFRKITIVTLLCVGLAGCSTVQGNEMRSTNPDSGLLEMSYTDSAANESEQPAQYTKLESFQNAPPVTEYNLTEGLYAVGTDLPQGTYTIEWMSGHDKFLITDSSGNVLKSALFGDTIYGDLKGFKDVALADGDNIEILGNLKIKFTKK